jgi:ankyrin repeat protein
MDSSEEPPTPFVLAYQAVEAGDREQLVGLLDRFPDLVVQRVTAIHLASQAGERETVLTLLELGADPLIVDELHGGDARGWASHAGHEDLADLLR